MTSVARAERAELCDLLLEVGPDIPTLCEGWTAADLAAHLIIRERRPIAAIGVVVSPMAGLTERSMSREKSRPWPEVVERIRSGPPLWWRPIDELANTVEYFVHHEDVRRGDRRAGPRPSSEARDEALWGATRRVGSLLGRGVKGAGLDLVWHSGEGERVRSVRKGEPRARLVGAPGELLLYLYGRKDVAAVEIDGDPDAAARVRESELGF